MEMLAPISFPRALHVATHRFLDLDVAPFDVDAYSRLKFGSDKAAKRFGREMADDFYARHFDILKNNKCVVIPAPSTTVAVAATLLSRHFMNRINALLARDGVHPVEWTMIHRNMSYNNNYAELPKEERRKCLANDVIYVNKSFVEGKFLIFIDDCTITGAHEEKLTVFLGAQDVLNDHAFVCFAKYEGEDPSIEMRLNHYTIKDAYDLAQLTHEEGHTVTTRSLRLFFQHPHEDFVNIMNACSERFVEEAFYAAIVKGYNVHPTCVENFNTVAHRLGMGKPVLVA